jgi:hypothetical protein
MRFLSGIAFFTVASVLALSAPPVEPGQLLKPVVPGSNSIRVRIPVFEAAGTTMHFKAQIPGGKGKKGELFDVEVGVETMPGRSYVSAKLWERWGYEVPANKMIQLPELVIPASQLAPKLSTKSATKGYDVQVKVPTIALEIIEPPGGAEKVLRCDIHIHLSDLTRNADRTAIPRLYFQDRFLELTVPSGWVKHPGGGDEAPSDPAITADPELVVVAGPMVNKNGLQVFSYASLNGVSQYKTADGKSEQVHVSVASTSDFPPTGVSMAMGTARGCGLEMEQDKDAKATGATYETRSIKGKVKELRLGVMSGPGLKTQKDIVIQDLTVFIDKSNSGNFVHLDPRFLETYFKDPIYDCGSDGIFQLHGRVKPDLLQEIKTRPKK